MSQLEVSTSPGPVSGDPRGVRALLATRRSQRVQWPYRLYLVGLTATPLALLASQAAPTWSSQQADVLRDAVTISGPVVVLALLLLAGRFASWAGLLVPPPGEVAWVLTAPIDHRRWLWPRLLRALGRLAAVGAGLGGALALGTRLVVPIPLPTLLGGGMLTGACVGIVTGGWCWIVQCSPRLSRWGARGAAPLALLVGAAGVGVPLMIDGGRSLLWSGPWGWPVLPLAAAAGVPGASWPRALAVTGALVATVVAGLWWRAASAPHDELARRADPMVALRASAFLFDLRSATRARRRSLRALAGAPRISLPPPSSARLALPWVGATLLVRSPRWLVTGLVAGVVLHLAAGPQSSAIEAYWLGFAGALVASVQSLEPLRIEQSDPFADRHLPDTSGRRLARLLVAPLGAMLVAIAAASATAIALGTAWPTVTVGAAVATLTAPPMVLCAAWGATTPEPPLELLAAGDTGVITFFAHLAAGPLLAVTLVGTPGAVVLGWVARGAGTPSSAAVALLLVVAVAGGTAWSLRRRVLADQAP